VKPTEILLDLNDLKLGRIIKKDFEEAVVDILAKQIETFKGAETLPVAPKWAETLPTVPRKGFETAPKAVETRKAAESK
jgi:hypothetical protein